MSKGLSRKEVEEVLAEINHRREQDLMNHGAGRAVQKAYEDRAEGLDLAARYLYGKIAAKKKVKV